MASERACGRYKRDVIGDVRWASGNESEVDSRPSAMDIKNDGGKKKIKKEVATSESID